MSLALNGCVQVVYSGEWTDHSAQDVQPSFGIESSIQNDDEVREGGEERGEGREGGEKRRREGEGGERKGGKEAGKMGIGGWKRVNLNIHTPTLLTFLFVYLISLSMLSKFIRAFMYWKSDPKVNMMWFVTEALACW